jgi:hypothetical protein
MSRPTIVEKPNTRISILLPEKASYDIRALAALKGISLAELLRQLITSVTDEHRDEIEALRALR